MRILNLYSGLGGNRKLWPQTLANGTNVSITAVEIEPDIARMYKKLYPMDRVIVGDAHKYLEKHWMEFDFIWSSPPCQSHSQLVRCRNIQKDASRVRFPDLKLYEEILFLREWCRQGGKGRGGKEKKRDAIPWLVENVKPYYEPLIAPTYAGGRHYFWSNFRFGVQEPPRHNSRLNDGYSHRDRWRIHNRKQVLKWMGYPEDLVVKTDGSNNRGKALNSNQTVRNMVHPVVGLQILEAALGLRERKFKFAGFGVV